MLEKKFVGAEIIYGKVNRYPYLEKSSEKKFKEYTLKWIKNNIRVYKNCVHLNDK